MGPRINHQTKPPMMARVILDLGEPPKMVGFLPVSLETNQKGTLEKRQATHLVWSNRTHTHTNIGGRNNTRAGVARRTFAGFQHHLGGVVA